MICRLIYESWQLVIVIGIVAIPGNRVDGIGLGSLPPHMLANAFDMETNSQIYTNRDIGFVCEFFTPLTGKQNERQIGILPAECFENFEAVLAGQVGIRDTAVEAVLNGSIQSFTGARCHLDTDRNFLLCKHRSCQVQLHEIMFPNKDRSPTCPVNGK